MNDSKMSESSTSASKSRSSDVMTKYYDQYFVKTDNLSLIKLILYTPVGLSLALVRLVLLAIFFVLLYLCPAFKNNPVFVKLVGFALGIVTRVESCDITGHKNTSEIPRIYVSNHITCFDYVSLKTVIIRSNYLEEKLMNRNLTSNRVSRDLVTANLIKLLQYNTLKHNTDNIYTNKNEFPFIFFPELIATNGAYGVLKFDPKPFCLEQENMKVAVVPVALNATRPFVSLSVNWLGSSDLVNIGFMLFAPFTLFKVKFFPEQFLKENEPTEVFADRVQRIIANGLRLVCSNLDRENIRQMWTDYEKNQLERQERQEHIHRQQERQRDDALFGDVARIVSQVKNVLPYVSYEVVREHVVLTSSSDVDTVITSILDAGVELEAATNTTTTSPAKPIQKSPAVSNSSPSSASPAKFQSYETRKTNLLSEARKRYLAKH